MSAPLYGLIVPLVIIAVLLIIILAVFLYIRFKVRDFSKRAFGTPDIIKGAKEIEKTTAETPRSIHSMTDIYLPQIHKDFPEFDYDLFKGRTESVLRSYFAAISQRDSSALSEYCSNSLKNAVISIIEDLESRNYKHILSTPSIHQIDIARYIKDGATVTIIFNVSVGHYDYVEDENGKIISGNSELKKQSVYEVSLVYIQDSAKMKVYTGDAMGISCPNCGAPIKNLGQKFCDYCGTGVVEVNTRSWSFEHIKEQVANKGLY